MQGTCLLRTRFAWSSDGETDEASCAAVAVPEAVVSPLIWICVRQLVSCIASSCYQPQTRDRTQDKLPHTSVYTFANIFSKFLTYFLQGWALSIMWPDTGLGPPSCTPLSCSQLVCSCLPLQKIDNWLVEFLNFHRDTQYSICIDT